MSDKLLETVRIRKVTVWPLDEQGENDNHEYFKAYSKGFRMPAIKEEFLLANLRNAAKAISMNSNLGYVYKFGDATVFTVKYALGSKSSPRTLTFVTTDVELE